MAFRKSKAAKIGGKFLIYGESGTSKSTTAITFPNIAAIDSETGLGFYEGQDIKLNNGNTYNNIKLIDSTSDLDTLEEALDSFSNGDMDKEGIETLVIDSETKFYNAMQIACQEVEERRARRQGKSVDDTNLSMRSWGRIKMINMKLQQAKIDLSSRGWHIVSVAQGELKYEGEGDKRKPIGIFPQMHKSVGFDYDVILQTYTETKDGELKYFAKIIKDRTSVFKVGDVIENPCYDYWKEYFESRGKLKTIATSYKKDIETSTENLVEKTDKAEELAEKLKDIMKKMKVDKNTDGISKIGALIKEKGIDIKKLEMQTVEDLTELVDFAELQVT